MGFHCGVRAINASLAGALLVVYLFGVMVKTVALNKAFLN